MVSFSTGVTFGLARTRALTASCLHYSIEVGAVRLAAHQVVEVFQALRIPDGFM